MSFLINILISTFCLPYSFLDIQDALLDKELT